MRCGVLFFCSLFWFGSVWGQSCYNIFTPQKPKIKFLLKSKQLNRLFNKSAITVNEQVWLDAVNQIKKFEAHKEHNFSVETKKLSLEGSAVYSNNTLNLKLSFLSTNLASKFTDKKHFAFLKNNNRLNLNEINYNLRAPLKEVIGFIKLLAEEIKAEHPHINQIELTADTIYNERLYYKLKSLHFKKDVPFLKRLVQTYYLVGNAALYSFLVTGMPMLEWYEVTFVSAGNAALFWIPLRNRLKKFKYEGASLKLIIPLVESDNSRL